MLSVILISRFTIGYMYGIAASIAATLLFNYLFTSPYYTLTVDNPSYIITFVIMTTTAIITSALTTRTNQNKIKAEEKESETKALYNLTSRLTDALDIDQIASVSAQMISNVLDCKAGCLPFNHNRNPERYFIQQVSPDEQIKVELDDPEALKYRILSLRSGYDITEDYFDWPIYGQENILGIIRIPKETAVDLDDAHKRLLLSMIENTALAMDRVYLAEERLKSFEETTQERHRGNLLRGISHDLRTPLSGIMATSEMLKDMTLKTDSRYDMMEAINTDAIWLHSLVENVLSLTRLQEGKLTLDKEEEAIEEVIDEAIRQIKKRAPEQRVNVDMPKDVLLVPMDGKLIMQVFINLLENTIKHTSSNKPITIVVDNEEIENKVLIKVIDQGNGIADEELENIFKPFYTAGSKHADAKNRVGLGLSICDSIVNAHGGEIWAQNREDGTGAELIFSLPLEGDRNGSIR
ncbi:MAG: DUF4118 domain-containing protein [Alkalibacterium sp.]|nr:DUF4118 domain-containing protein [Alkalibacterium sp.]